MSIPPSTYPIPFFDHNAEQPSPFVISFANQLDEALCIAHDDKCFSQIEDEFGKLIEENQDKINEIKNKDTIDKKKRIHQIGLILFEKYQEKKFLEIWPKFTKQFSQSFSATEEDELKNVTREIFEMLHSVVLENRVVHALHKRFPTFISNDDVLDLHSATDQKT